MSIFTLLTLMSITGTNFCPELLSQKDVFVPRVETYKGKSGIHFLIDSAYNICLPLDSLWDISDSGTLRLTSSKMTFNLVVDYSDNRLVSPVKPGKYYIADTSQLYMDTKEIYASFFDTLFKPGEGGYTVFPNRSVLKKFETEAGTTVFSYLLRIHNRYSIYIYTVFKEEDTEMLAREISSFEKALTGWKMVD